MNFNEGASYWVWGVETEEEVTTVRAVASTYYELVTKIGNNGRIPIPSDCDGICDLLPATPELSNAIRMYGIGIPCRLVERDGELVFDCVR